MVAAAKTVAIGASTLGLLSLMSGLVYVYNPWFGHDEIPIVMHSEQSGAVAGRIVTIPAKMYQDVFDNAQIRLGDCPMVMVDGQKKPCNDKFGGDVIHLAKASTTVDVSRVRSTEDITMHYSGSLGTSVGVLGLVSVGVKYKVAVTTHTNKKDLNLMSSYEIKTGVLTLHNPRPVKVESNRPLFLSEIELGGNEMLLVTISFESEEKKVEVEITLTFKILFISISAKLRFMHKTFKTSAKCRIQFKSSWRSQKELQDVDEQDLDMDRCISRAEYYENLYFKGPKELRDMDFNDPRFHYFYYFSSWKGSPYGQKYNLAVINYDLEFLNGQKTEMQGVIDQINHSELKSYDNRYRELMQLNKTLTEKTRQLTSGLEKYHTLSPTGRQRLLEIYGMENAPQFYRRLYNKITS